MSATTDEAAQYPAIRAAAHAIIARSGRCVASEAAAAAGRGIPIVVAFRALDSDPQLERIREAGTSTAFQRKTP